jgi:hypothetical protein
MFCANCLFHIESITDYREQVCYTKRYMFCCEKCYYLWFRDSKNWKIREELEYSYFKKRGEEDRLLRIKRPIKDKVCEWCNERERRADPTCDKILNRSSGLRTKK